jgi:excisionase family DNA binding protein
MDISKQDADERKAQRVAIGLAALYLGVTPQTLRRWERDGLITAFRTPGGERRFRVSDLDALLSRRPA